MRLRGGFHPHHMNRFTVELLIRREFIKRVPERILAHHADIETLTFDNRVRWREPNEFPKIEEVRGLHIVLRHLALSRSE